MYVTYAELIQIGIFMVALIGLCYQVFKGNHDHQLSWWFALRL